MSFPLSSLPTEYLPAAATDASALLSARPAADPHASFESVLTQADSGEKTAEDSLLAPDETGEDSPVPLGAAPFTAGQLAAILAFLGSSATQTPLPPPSASAMPATFDFDCPSAPLAAEGEPTQGTAVTTAPLLNSPRAPSFGLPASGLSAPTRLPREWSARAADTAAQAAPLAPATPAPLVVPAAMDCAPATEGGVPAPATPAAPQPLPSARQLVEAGAEVVTYQLAPSTKGGTEPAVFAPVREMVTPTKIPEGMATVSVPAVTPVVEPSAITEAQVASPDASTPAVTIALTPTPTPRRDLRRGSRVTPKADEENIAGPVPQTPPSKLSGVKSSISSNENKYLSVDGQQLPGVQPVVGTTIANWGESMRPETQSQLVSRVADAAALSAEFSALIAQPSISEADKSAPHASQIVREIREIADSLWAVERNSVEVRFNFSDTERLSVRVEYREGVVKTTFHTDSPELRDTLAREWQAQLPVAEARAYRIADPVFNAQPPAGHGVSLGGDASRQQRQPEQPAQPSFYLAGKTGRASSGRDTLSTPVASPARAENSVHLQAFA